MIWIIIKREIHDNLLSARFALVIILCLILMTLGSYVSIKDYERRMGEYSVRVDEQKGPDAASMPKVYRKPEVLSLFSRGMERKLGTVAKYENYMGMGTITLGEEISSTPQSVYLKALAPADFDFVVRVVISLLAIFLAYDAISGERESGVLKLNIANSVPRSSILLGKFLGGVFCLCLPLVISFIISVLMIEFSASVELGETEWYRLGMILLVSILYLLVFYALGLFISSLTKTSAMSLMVSMLIWILLVVVIPNAGPALVKQLWHTTSREEMLRQQQELDQDYFKMENEKFGPWDKRDKSPETHIKVQELRNERNRAAWKLAQKHTSELDRQTEAGRWIARFSPSSAFSFAASAFARTDVHAYKRLINGIHALFTQADELQRLYFADMDKYNERTKDYKYSFQPSESIADSLSDAVSDIAILLLFAALFFIGAHAAFIRYDVR
jgi:ABC-type transport system involved in multi-copper enzyme maturation permease subunit